MRKLTERALAMRADAYIAGARSNLLLNTLVAISSAKHMLASDNRALRELDRLRTLFIGGVAHELNNPISAISGYAYLLLEGMAGELSDEQRAYLGKISRAAEQLSDLVADTVDVARLDRQGAEPNVEEFELHGALMHALEAVRERTDKRDLALNFEPARDLRMRSDRRRLIRCASNLIGYGAKHRRRDMVVLDVRRIDSEIELSFADREGQIEPAALDKLESLLLPGRGRATQGVGAEIVLYSTSRVVKEVLQGRFAIERPEGNPARLVFSLPVELS